MASAQIHREQAEHNEEAALSAKQNQPDWAVTMCFYAALHWVEYYALTQGRDLTADYPDELSPHSRRKKYVADLAYEKRWINFRKHYFSLEYESRIARYLEGLTYNARAYYLSQGCDTFFKYLETIKTYLQ